MPTENRSTMVSVPRELLERIDRMYTDDMSIFGECEEVRALLAQPAQHQGEPVALPARKVHHLDPSFLPGGDKGWNACLDEIAKLGPLYTRPAPAEQAEVIGRLKELVGKEATDERASLRGEVERLRNCLRTEIEAGDSWKKEAQDLRAQLAEAHALLRDALDNGELGRDDVYEAIHDYLEGHEDLSASAERNQCDGCQAGIPLVNGTHRMGKPGQYADTMSCQAGRYASAEPSAPKCETCSDHGIVGNILNAEPCPDCSYSAPVERDERADFEQAYQRAVDHGWSNVKHLARQLWDARAALERKTSCWRCNQPL